MSISINVDLDNYRDDIKELYCQDRCLMNYAGEPFKLAFKKYVDEFENDLLVFNRKRTQEQILSELKDLYYKLN